MHRWFGSVIITNIKDVFLIYYNYEQIPFVSFVFHCHKSERVFPLQTEHLNCKDRSGQYKRLEYILALDGMHKLSTHEYSKSMWPLKCNQDVVQ